MGCKKLALYPEKTSVTWHVRAFGEHKKIHVSWYDNGFIHYNSFSISSIVESKSRAESGFLR